MRESSTYFQVKAKYIPSADGGLRLASIQQFSVPKFRPSGWEDEHPKHRECKRNVTRLYNPYENEFKFEEIPPECDLEEVCKDMKNVGRAVRRAKLSAMDYILCNPDMDIFVTLTYGDDDAVDRLDYDECYAVLRTWLNNRVTRRNLKYVAVCERQKKGGIHFHILCNSSALKLVRAFSPYTGKPLTHRGKALYNVADWDAGFSSAEYITGDGCRDKVAKYIFKYMGKDTFSKIGGRYFLHGGKLVTPTYVYADRPEEVMDGSACVYERDVEISDGLTWHEWSFV